MVRDLEDARAETIGAVAVTGGHLGAGLGALANVAAVRAMLISPVGSA